jgi:hypothetical protein
MVSRLTLYYNVACGAACQVKPRLHHLLLQMLHYCRRISPHLLFSNDVIQRRTGKDTNHHAKARRPEGEKKMESTSLRMNCHFIKVIMGDRCLQWVGSFVQQIQIIWEMTLSG